MATVQTVIDNAKYKLRSVNSTQYTDAELLSYLNNDGIFNLDLILAANKSDLSLTKDTSLTLSNGNDSVTLPSTFLDIEALWIDTTELEKRSLQYIYEKLQESSTSNQPWAYALAGTSLMFNCLADQDYSLTLFYYTKHADLSLTDSMPYDDLFNNTLAQLIVLIAKTRNEVNSLPESAIYDHLRDAVMSNVISRRHVPRITGRPYK